jgi:uncharacterized damage-inducible protein DinB
MDLLLPIPGGYDPSTQSTVGTFAASLDDQLRRLRKTLEGLEVSHLEWQERPGRNTIGMLLAHLALVEIYWITMAPAGRGWDDAARATLQTLIGIEDDGLPLPADGAHPDYLAGSTPERYDEMLSRARAHIHAELRTWSDASLDTTYTMDRRGERVLVTRRWTLYHVLEHFAAHFGQIGLVKHLMRDKGLLTP